VQNEALMLFHTYENPTTPERVVVIGAGGFVGGAILKTLENKVVPVLAITRQDVDLLASGAADKLALLLKPTDCVIAVSAIAPVKNLEMLAQNMTILDAMTKAFASVKPTYLLNIGSDAVFGDDYEPLNEESAKAPGSLHGVMHVAREVAFGDLGIPMATLRPTLIYGVNDPHNGYGPNRFRRQAEARETITLFGEGEEQRDHVLVDDVAELASRMVLHQSTGSLNAVTGQVWSFREIASMIANFHDTPVAIKGSPRQGDMPHNGFRPFDNDATIMAFPDFSYIRLPDGLAKVHMETRS